jgi:hypothetical protein
MCSDSCLEKFILKMHMDYFYCTSNKILWSLMPLKQQHKAEYFYDFKSIIKEALSCGSGAQVELFNENKNKRK